MAHEVLMPKLGLTMTEGAVSEWKVKPGDALRAGAVILVVETDKVAFDVEAEVDGVLLDIAVAEGQTVPVGTPLARIGATRESAEPTTIGVAPAVNTRSPDAPTKAVTPVAPRSDGRVIATPLARKLAAAAGVDLATIVGTGPGGRIKAANVEQAATQRSDTGAAAMVMPASPPPALTKPAHTKELPGTTRRKPSVTQATMARRLSEVKQGVPHFYLAAEAEVSALQALRAQLNTTGEAPKITLTTFLVSAVGRSLVDIPAANTVWSDGELVTFAATDVGIAVHAPQGLYVPVMRDAGRKSLLQIAEDSHALIGRAREGRLSAAEMAGGAFTVSNAGMFNVTYLTPIVNPGQAAILGVGSVRKVFRPDDEGRPTLRQELGLVLAADHRVLDGVAGLALLNRIISYLEAPIRLLFAA
jgi:pyruvate dehydrogenase E2 component (dihydrolipoamide acetyltransferase)